MDNNKSRADEYLDRIQHLPPAPTLLVQLLELFKEPDRDLDRVVELIALDPSLTAEVLRLCNSASFGSGQPVDQMFDAVLRIGVYEIYRLVVAVYGASALAPSGAEHGARGAELWQHAVTTAVAAEAVAKHAQETESTAFTAALLHDIGKTVFLIAEGDKYNELLGRVKETPNSLLTAEEAAFGVDHAELGARLLTRWKLPTALVAAVRWHHYPGKAQPFERLAGCVHLANAIAGRLRQPDASTPEDVQAMADSAGAAGISPTDVPELFTQTRKGLERAKTLMSL